MEKLVIKPAKIDEFLGIVGPFLYNGLFVVSLNFNGSSGLLGYNNGIILFEPEENFLDKEIEIYIPETEEEVEAAISLANIVAKKISISDTLYINGIKIDQMDDLWLNVFENFNKFQRSFNKTKTLLL